MTTAVLQPLVDASAAILWRVSRATRRTHTLPIVVFYPTSRCNSRCVSCDWWQSTGADDLTLDEIEDVARALPGLGTKLVAFSGGEPLVRPDVFEIARRFRARDVRLHLLTSGLALERHAVEIGALFERVTISLDAATPGQYRAIRGVDGMGALEAGIARLRAVAPRVHITARSTLHAMNYRDLGALIRKARGIGADGISFLAADVMSGAFGRRAGHQPVHLQLDARQAAEFRGVIERVLKNQGDAFSSGFVSTSPAKLRLLPAYYAALNGTAPFPPVSCNAPEVSVVVEASGDVRPCFFHAVIGNVRERGLEAIVREDLPAFRRTLDVGCNATCQRCVCSIKVGMRNQPWR